jgi:Helix-turn-helix.
MPKTKQRSPSKQDIELGFRIRKRRQTLKLSLEYVSAALGISKQQLRKNELGRNKISAHRLNHIAVILKTTTDELLGKSPNKPCNECSDLDQEAGNLWMKIDDPEHKRTFIAMMKLVVKNNSK